MAGLAYTAAFQVFVLHYLFAFAFFSFYTAHLKFSGYLNVKNKRLLIRTTFGREVIIQEECEVIKTNFTGCERREISNGCHFKVLHVA